MNKTSTTRWRLLGVGALVLSMTLTACSSPGGASSKSSPVAGTSAKQADLSKYDGPDAAALKGGLLAKPAKKTVTGCHVGFLQAYAGQVNLLAMQNASEAALGTYGCTMTALDSQLNPQTQVTQFQQLLAQKVNAIILMPVAVTALQPELQQAKDQGIPVIGFNLPFDSSQPRNSYLVSNVSTSFDLADYAVMATLADAQPGSTFAVMGTAIPSDQLQYIGTRLKYWGKRLGLKYLGTVDALQDNPGAFTPAWQTIFTKWPKVQNVVSYSDNAALTASTVAAQMNITNVHIASSNGGANTIVPAIKAGKVYGTYFVPWDQAGQQMAYAAFLAITHQKVPVTIVLPSKMVTRDTVADFKFVG
jgi:ribose transport system substrate-binding protein